MPNWIRGPLLLALLLHLPPPTRAAEAPRVPAAQPTAADTARARELVLEATRHAPPITDIRRRRIDWQGDTIDEFVLDNMEYFTLGNLVELQWLLGDTALARRNSEVIVPYRPYERSCGNAGVGVLKTLRRNGMKRPARELLELAVVDLKAPTSSDLGSTFGPLAIEMGFVDVNRAVRMVRGPRADSLAAVRLRRFYAGAAKEGLVLPDSLQYLNEPWQPQAFQLAWTRPPNVAMARHWIEAIDPASPERGVFLAALAEAQQQAGAWDDAEQTIDQVLLLFAGDEVPPPKHPNLILEAITRALNAMGNRDRVARDVLPLAKGDTRSNILLSQAGSLARSGLADSARAMLAAVLSHPGGEEAWRDVRDWARAMAVDGYDDLALQVVDGMKGSDKVEALGNVMRGQSLRGDFASAGHTMSMIHGAPLARGVAGLGGEFPGQLLTEVTSGHMDMVPEEGPRGPQQKMAHRRFRSSGPGGRRQAVPRRRE